MFKICHDQIKARFPYDRYHRCDRCDREEKKKLQRSQWSYETTLQRTQRQWSLRYKKFYLSDRCRCDHWRMVSIWSLNFFFSANTAITAIIVIIWRLSLIYRNSPNSWHKFPICCTNMYLIRFRPNFATFWVCICEFRGILWIYLNFAALRPCKISEALNITAISKWKKFHS